MELLGQNYLVLVVVYGKCLNFAMGQEADFVGPLRVFALILRFCHKDVMVDCAWGALSRDCPRKIGPPRGN